MTLIEILSHFLTLNTILSKVYGDTILANRFGHCSYTVISSDDVTADPLKVFRIFCIFNEIEENLIMCNLLHFSAHLK